MTYTILARCPRTGQMGLGIATYSIGVGLYCNGLRSRKGATMTQAFVNQGNNPFALRLLTMGFTPTHVLRELQRNDPDHEYRQIGVIDREGNAVAYSGPKTRGWSGHRIAPGAIAMGNVLAGEHVVDAILSGFTASPDAILEHRLLAALEAGRDAGGQLGNDGHLTERSAAIIVYDDADYAELDIRVDLHDHAVDELRRNYEEYALYRGYYTERGKNPAAAIPQHEFVRTLPVGEQPA